MPKDGPSTRPPWSGCSTPRSVHTSQRAISNTSGAALAGYEDLNDAQRLSTDPTFRLIGSPTRLDRRAALTSTLHWFETELLTRDDNLDGLMAVNRDLIGQAEMFDRADRIVLDMDSSESPVHGQQEGSAYNGHFASVCYHPLFLFTDHGDCVAAKLRPGNVSQRGRLGGTACARDRPPAGRGTARRVPGRRRLRAAGDLRSAGGARRPVRDPDTGKQELGAGDRRPPVSVTGTAQPQAAHSVQEEIIEVDAHPVAGIRHFLIRESLCLVEDV